MKSIFETAKTPQEKGYLACAYAEGFCEGEDATEQQQLEAWAYLIKTGECWGLQGWYGRTAQSLIDREIISAKGEILQML